MTKLVSVEIVNICWHTEPCQHNVIFRYSNGSERQVLMYGKDIYIMCKDRLPPAYARHFHDCYKKHLEEGLRRAQSIWAAVQ